MSSGRFLPAIVQARYVTFIPRNHTLFGKMHVYRACCGGKNEIWYFSFQALNRPLAVCTLLTLSFSALFADVSAQDTGHG